MHLIAEDVFDLSNSAEKMRTRLYAPEHDRSTGDWHCTFEIDSPLSVRQTIFGVSSLQALVLALKVMAATLYGSDSYANKEFGFCGEFGGNLSLPAPATLLDIAPYPF